MKRITPLLVLFNFLLAFASLNAQSTFMVKDSSTTVGIDLISGSDIDNALFIKVAKKEVITYTADQLSGYGLKDGRVYQSFAINHNGQQRRYFLERLSEGQYEVYYLRIKGDRRYYLLGADDQLIQLPNKKAALRSFLKTYVADCTIALNNLKHLAPNKNSLKRFFNSFENCSNRLLPRFRLGLHAGIQINRFLPPNGPLIDDPFFQPNPPTALGRLDHFKILNLADYDFTPSYTFGLFALFPVGGSHQSLRLGVNTQFFNNTLVFEENPNNRFELVTDQIRLAIPLAFRHTFYNTPNLPFLELGVIYSHIIIENGTLTNTQVISNNETVDVFDLGYLGKNQMGFSFGTGLIFNYAQKFSLHTQLTYQYALNINPSIDALKLHALSLDVGVLF
ncbi:MAG: hypothetical protein AAGD05_13470 [Bacteroidota bacterium]